MTPLFAIVKLTFKASIRSHVFQALLVLLFLGVVLVPNTVKGDGTAFGFVQVSIDYSLWIISMILSMSAVWSGCSVMSLDVESGQIHMVVTKPISRYKVFLGKLLGVLALHAALMFIAAAAAFGFVQLQFKWQKFSPEERQRVSEEVMAGRRAYMPDMPDFRARISEEFARRQAAFEASSGKKFSSLPEAEQGKILGEAQMQVYTNQGEIKAGPDNTKFWEFSGLPGKSSKIVCVKYKAYRGSADSKDQKISYGMWLFRSYVDERTLSDSGVKTKGPAAEDKGPAKMTEVFFVMSREPEKILCAAPLEFKIPAEGAIKDGKAKIGFTNFDPEGRSLVIQPSDGPKLMIAECTFFENFLRAALVAFMRVAILAGIACAAGAVFSMPVAVFMVIAYITIGFFASFLVGSQLNYGENPNADSLEKFGLATSKVIMLGVMPLHRFEVSEKLASGELIEWSFIARLFFECMILKGIPLCLLGAWIYWRREIGIALKR